jgi:hypothetical protein
MNRLDNAIARIAEQIDQNIGWYAASHYLSTGLIDRGQFRKLTEFEGLEGNGVHLSDRQLHARREINRFILDEFTDLELFELGVDVDELSVAKNGWRR